MTLAEVLSQHGDCVSCDYLERGRSGCQLFPCSKLLAALEAARPQPSREALVKLLEDYQGFTHCRFGKYHGLCQKCVQLVEAVLAWATGQPREKTWCDHLTWSSKSWWLGKLDDKGIMRVPDDWTVCPLCAAPRPA